MHFVMSNMSDSYYVYIVCCQDGTLYCGIARDLAQRMNQHNTDDTKGARYTRSRRPVRLVYSEQAPNRSTALRREYVIKQMSRTQKQALISSANTS
jgi:putative endonuclease